MKVLAVEVELLVRGPEAAHDLHPLLGVVVTRVVRQQDVPNISNSTSLQPQTMFSVNRPPEMWSIVMACFAATTG